MARMFLLYSQTLTYAQKMEACEDWGVTTIIPAPSTLQVLWGKLPVGTCEINTHISPVLAWLEQEIRPEDLLLVQGETGGVYQVVTFCKSNGIRAMYSAAKHTTVEDRFPDGDTITTTIYRHIRFCLY